MNKLLLTTCCLLLATFGTSCQRHYAISGSADAANIEGRVITLGYLDADHWVHLDSCAVTHGFFHMRGSADSVFMATLFVDEIPLMPLVLEPGKIRVSISNLRLAATGTRLNNRLYDFLSRKNDLDAMADEIDHQESQMIMNGYRSERVEAYRDSAYDALSNDMETLVLGFMSDNYDNVLSLCGFSMMTNGLARPVVTPLIRKVLDDSPAEFREQPAVRAFLSAAGN